MKTQENQGYHILVVDDEPEVRQCIKMLLEHDGHEVQTVDSGEAALALLEHNTFDLITTDYSMAGMKGDQLAATIKKCRPGQPIIMVTAFAADFHPSGKPTGGVDCVLSKPFTMIELREAIALVMSPKAAPPIATTPSATLIIPPEVPPPPDPGDSGSGRMRT
jgi:CheY-like chemotaxis protein